MSKIDCSKTENFLRELSRATKNCDNDCSKCVVVPLCTGFLHPQMCMEYILHSPEDTISIVQNWIDTHPIKTRLDDLKEKYPNFRMDIDKTYPAYYPHLFGYCKNCHTCAKLTSINNGNNDCWNEPLEGGATGE